MPTFEIDEPFWRDHDRLSAALQEAFKRARLEFIEDLRLGRFRPSLRVKRVQIEDGVWELTWAADGRATFSYGAEVIPGQPHIVWRHVGTHDILRRP